MKILATTCLLTFTGILAFGQTVTVNGTVNNEKGQPVPFAFVADVQHNKATFTDSTGVFKLNSDPSSSLVVMANNYQDKQLKIEGNANVNVTLKSGADQGSVESLKSGQTFIPNKFVSTGDMLVIGKGTVAQVAGAGNRSGGVGGSDVQIVKEGFVQEPTRGSRYLFNDWVPGYGLDKNEKIVVEKSNLYNYDKISGNLLYTNDGKSMARISASQLSSFTLFDRSGHAHAFENAPGFKGGIPFVEVLISAPKYKIYKKIDTRLQRADFHTDGVVDVGHRYDEYVDVERYYFVGEDGKAKSISLRKNTLKKLLGSDADAFIASQGSRDVDEEYVKDLGKSLSK